MASAVEKILQGTANIATKSPQGASIGLTCTYIPVEILEAAGLRPRRIRPEPSSEKADAYLDPNFCPYVRACLGKALDGGYGELQGVIIANTCDAMRRLHDAWRYYCASGFHFLLDVPRIATAEATRYFKARLEDLISNLQSHFRAKIGEEELREAVKRVNRTRALLDMFFSLKSRGLMDLGYADVLAISDKQWELPRESYNSMLKQVLKITSERTSNKPEGPRVFVTGSILDGTALVDLVEDFGATVAGVDNCVAERTVPQVPLERDILWGLAETYLHKIPCARMKDSKRRAEYIIGRMRETGAGGLIYMALKFCDPYLYEWPYVVEELRRRGIPVLFLEGEYRGRISGGMRTRIQAFLEMLGTGRSAPRPAAGSI